VNADDGGGGTPLHYAAEGGGGGEEYKEIVELLLANGADVNAKADHGMTPLHRAAKWDHKEVAELLIAKGADVNAKVELSGRFKGQTPVDFATFKNNPNRTETADLLRKHGGKSSAEFSIHIASRMGNVEALKQHIAAGADVNAKDDKNITPLLWAISYSQEAFDDSISYSHKEIVELLVVAGADVNVEGGWGGITPLEAAEDYPEIADLLRKLGGKTGDELKAAEPVAEAVKPEPPTAKAPDISIHDAAKDGNIKAVKQHLAAGADVNVKNNHGRTSLLMAAWWDHKETVELLIGAGADVNAMAGNGVTPLDLSIKLNLAEITELLRKHGGKTGVELKAEGK